MRGNPFVNLVAILVMLASVLIGGKMWIDWKASKGEPVRKEVQQELKIEKKEIKVETFEQAVKHTN